MVRNRILVGIFLGLLCPSAQAYTGKPLKEQLVFIARANPLQVKPEQVKSPFKWNETSEIKLLGTGLIRFYQRYISTQDLPLCNFHPSCSQFSMLSIQRYGFIRGVLLAADRITRDNGLEMHPHYPHDHETGRLYDPVENYSPEALKPKLE